MIAVALANIGLIIACDRLSCYGIDRKIRNLCSDLMDYATRCSWSANSYVDLHSPIVSTIHSHWTLRDGNVVNLPVSLIVRDDVILIFPGRVIHVDCVTLSDSFTASDSDIRQVFTVGDRYIPTFCRETRTVDQPTALELERPRLCRVTATPAFDFVREILLSNLSRRMSELDHLLVRVSNSVGVYILCLFLITMVASVAKFFVVSSVSLGYMLIYPVFTTLPILFLSSSCFWYALNIYELAAVLVTVHKTSEQPEENIDKTESNMDEISMETLTETITSLDSDFEETEDISWADIFAKVKYLLTENAEVDWNLVHSFGTMSRLCCADKEGVLCLPIPLPDKVLFLRKKHKHKVPSAKKKSEVSLQSQMTNPGSEAHFQTLDISHDPKVSYRIDFDDAHWQKYLKSLKPIGLSLVLNNCHPKVKANYNSFADFVTAKSLVSHSNIIVPKRRCLCDLAKLIGFRPEAADPFKLNFTLGTFQQTSKDQVIRENLYKFLSSIKQKTPVSNAFSSVFDQRHMGAQLLCQGSADIIVEMCSDYWNGNNIVQLKEVDRKKLLDFYHRHNYANYCLALSYAPVTSPTTQSNSNSLANQCIELPPYHSMGADDSPNATPTLPKCMSRTFSVETRLNSNSAAVSVNDVQDCIKIQSNQIFLGLVTSQFQANSDVVRMIDQLERGCIRFVYFSEENELRSRGFAERLGLESGWNCHISLRPDSAQGSRNTVVGTEGVEEMRKSAGDRSTALTESCYGFGISNKCTNASHWGSAPALFNTEMNKVTFRFEVEENLITPVHQIHEANPESSSDSSDSETEAERLLTTTNSCRPSVSPAINTKDDNLSLSSSCNLASSHVSQRSEESDGVFIDPNKSRLPRGIAQIRPHLQLVDNVPLQVSLFTDCTPSVISEMLLIMEQYGERIALLYSALSRKTCLLAPFADVSISFTPQLPPTCRNRQKKLDCDGPSPIFVASCIGGIPSHYFTSKLNFTNLIAKCRCSLDRLKRPIRAFLSFSLMFTVMMSLCSILLLPPPLSNNQISLLSFIVIPILSFSTVAKSEDVMRAIQYSARRRDVPRRKVLTLRYIALHTALTLPSALVGCIATVLFIYRTCFETLAEEGRLASSNNTGTVLNNLPSYFADISQCLNHSFWKPIAPQLFAFQIVLFMFLTTVCIISSYVFISEHSSIHFMKRLATIKYWIVTIIFLFMITFVYASMDLAFRSSWAHLLTIPLEVYIILLIWTVFLPFINHIISKRQQRIKTKEDRAAKLHFETKLGMYSPV